MVGVLSSQYMTELLANTSLVLEPEKLLQLTEAHERPIRGARATLLSAINSVFVSNADTDKLASPVTFAFSHQVSPEEGREGSIAYSTDIPQRLCTAVSLCLGTLPHATQSSVHF